MPVEFIIETLNLHGSLGNYRVSKLLIDEDRDPSQVNLAPCKGPPLVSVYHMTLLHEPLRVSSQFGERMTEAGSSLVVLKPLGHSSRELLCEVSQAFALY